MFNFVFFRSHFQRYQPQRKENLENAEIVKLLSVCKVFSSVEKWVIKVLSKDSKERKVIKSGCFKLCGEVEKLKNRKKTQDMKVKQASHDSMTQKKKKNLCEQDNWQLHRCVSYLTDKNFRLVNDALVFKSSGLRTQNLRPEKKLLLQWYVINVERTKKHTPTQIIYSWIDFNK